MNIFFQITIFLTKENAINKFECYKRIIIIDKISLIKTILIKELTTFANELKRIVPSNDE